VIRLKLLGGPRAGQVLPFGTEPLRIGRGASAQLRFDDAAYGMVSTHHAQIVFERGGFQLIDTGSRNGTFVNGRRLSDRHRLVHGDRLCFGHPGGPEVEVELDEAALAPTAAFHIDPAAERTLVLEPRPGATASPSPAPAYDAHADAERLAQHLRDGLQGGLHDTAAHEVVREAAQQVAERRARAGGQRSGDTVMLLAQAMHKASARVEHRTRSRWQKLLAGVGGAALLVIAVLGAVVLWQQRALDALIETKAGIDRQIAVLEERLQVETDPTRLAALEESLVALTGTAQSTLKELRARDEARAAELATAGDALDRDIRRILAKFNASTYAVPPIFRERLQHHIREITSGGTLRAMLERRQRYWPMIQKEFAALGLPDEMAHIAWVESAFDPNVRSPAGALGLWQMTASTAQSLGLVVDGSVDERLDPEKQTRAAATYLARLLSEFGEDSFMLVLASYNRGENGVRRALRQVAQEAGGFRKDKRDFWHLYRLKLLPEETREYVPRVLAAAIVASDPQRFAQGRAPGP
jgi:soluble lytic murein transglycosylase-like protein